MRKNAIYFLAKHIAYVKVMSTLGYFQKMDYLKSNSNKEDKSLGDNK